MATASSQTPASAANAPAAGAVRSSSAGGPSLSESPAVLAPSLSLPGAATNGVANGLSNSLAAPPDGAPGAEMRIYPRDGRVRNPVPSKLKNVNEQMKGNFGVMHMDVASHRASEGRDAAAKRTSESTALQAKLAQTDVSSDKPEQPAVEPGPPRPLTFAETKAEQARLLTLLRTLPHHTVVDQICKGLAFFGGTPDAPPPADGKFPESAEANGSGSLFVGWIAEIFPDLEHPRPRYVGGPAAQAANQKRPRGRPKGSKASKSRSDKGLKKGLQKSSRAVEDQAQDPHDDSWVDVEDSVMEPNDNRDLVEAMVALRNAPSTPPDLNDGGIPTTVSGTGSAAGFRSINDASLTPGSSSKKRGRPKGSKNRPKDKSALQSIPPPKVTPVPVPVPMLDGQSKNKSNSAKSKPTKNRPGPLTEAPNDNTAVSTPSQQQPQQRADPHVPPDLSSVQAPAAALDFAVDPFTTSGVNGTITHDQDNRQPAQPTAPVLPSPASQVKASTVTAKKRKRPTGNTTIQVESTGSLGGTSSNPQHIQPTSMQVTPSVQLQNQTTQPIHQPTPTNANVPPVKRARKSQESSSAATARRQTPNSMSQKAPAPSGPVVPETTHQPDDGDVETQSHPPAEGLEAHYAAMQSHTDQMQSYSNSRPQLKQQPHSSSSMGSTVSPAPVAAPAPAGLDAHYEHFTALQNLSDSSRQATTGRQKQQQPTQTASPAPSQPSKLPQMPATLTSHQQSRAPQNYYAQSQGQGLGSSYNSQQSSYSGTQRSQQHIANASPNAGLVQHVTNSPQFSTQSNSPIMQTENNYRGSPSLMHNNAAFATRRTPTASPLDNTTYRSSSATNHGVANHSPHFGARQTSAAATTHNTSHSGLSSTFPTFSDSSLFEMSLDSGASHGNIGIGGNSYTLSSGAVPQQQRSSGSNAASLYSSPGMNNTYIGSTGMGRTGQQNRWGT
ncbi:putative DNA binding domain with preference for A T rich regions-like protein [Rosellinia necatrix]|uniref:Putative DNA binding domain with preference for A T rich regions-like protein n=1 Tax=Rosellinia necatrix TaxID=77044 RepID=A0A1S7UHE5_ROSNE|nr:putative DNA binding domain with preference for A T rich regions-like protein [Rosellinia necatrix]